MCVQNKVLPPLIAGIVGNLANAVAHYIFIYHSDIGIMWEIKLAFLGRCLQPCNSWLPFRMHFRGSAIAQSVCYFFQASCILVYIIASGIYRYTWNGEFFRPKIQTITCMFYTAAN